MQFLWPHFFAICMPLKIISVKYVQIVRQHELGGAGRSTFIFKGAGGTDNYFRESV